MTCWGSVDHSLSGWESGAYVWISPPAPLSVSLRTPVKGARIFNSVLFIIRSHGLLESSDAQPWLMIPGANGPRAQQGYHQGDEKVGAHCRARSYSAHDSGLFHLVEALLLACGFSLLKGRKVPPSWVVKTGLWGVTLCSVLLATPCLTLDSFRNVCLSPSRRPS